MEARRGFHAKKDFADFRKWETAQKKLIERSQAGKHGYNKTWCKQRLADIAKARDHGLMFVATGRKRVELRHLILAPARYHTLFLMLDRPLDGAVRQ